MYTKTMKNVERLKTPMFVYVIVFSVVAIANAIVQAAYRNGCKQKGPLSMIKNVTSILQQLLMAVVVVLFGYAAVNLLSRLRMMIPKNAEGLTVKRKLSKLTFFIFAEVAVAIIMSVTWMTRSVFLPKLEDDSPYAYFGLKVMEKFFEFLGLFLLSMTIGAKAQPKKQIPKFTSEKTDRVRRGMSVAKRPEGVKKSFGWVLLRGEGRGGRGADRQTGRQAGRQTDRQTDRRTTFLHVTLRQPQHQHLNINTNN